PLAAAIIVVFLMVNGWLLAGTFRKSHRLGAAQIAEGQVTGSILIDAINGLRTIRSMGAEDHVVRQYQAGILRYANIAFEIDAIASLSRLGPALILIAAAVGGLMWIGKVDSASSAFGFALLVYRMRFFRVVGLVLTFGLR